MVPQQNPVLNQLFYGDNLATNRDVAVKSLTK
jgi:hypothetical protein